MNNIAIRLEIPADFRKVEALTRDAFWNLFVPGCDEHYFAHILRSHSDFIPKLDFVALREGEVIGNIMYSHSYVLGSDGEKHPTITFGPLSVLPKHQSAGVGSALITRSLERAKELGHSAVLIYGDPAYYKRFGFRSCKDYGITSEGGKFPAAHLALELRAGALEGFSGTAHESPVFLVNPNDSGAFDQTFLPREKSLETESQKEFLKIASTYL